MKKKYFWIISVSILTICVVIYISISSNQKLTPVDLKEMQNEVAEEISMNESYQNKTMEWAKKNAKVNMELDLGFYEPNQHSDVSPERNVINYFMTGLLQNNIDYFTSAFDVEVLSQDLFQSKEENKELVVKEIIKRISRNGTIEGLKVKESKGGIGPNSNKVLLEILYKDDISKKVNFFISPSEYSHSLEHQHSTFSIVTSAWDIVKQIEGTD
ncbi:hypothetical protein [Niallia sp. Marseille-Q9988]|nr:hypothetical protein [Niallia sp. MER TA 168]CAI9386628.1 hypothetical protein BACSP_01701 [Bacillus sp. T2.9-1]